MTGRRPQNAVPEWLIGASRDELAKTLSLAFADLPVAPSDSAVSFLAEALMFLRAWMESQHAMGYPENAPGAILYSGELRPEGEEREYQRLRYFRHDLMHPVSGRITLCSPSLTDAYQASSNAQSVGELANALHAAGLSSRPTLLVMPGQRKVIVCPNGISDPDDAYELEIPVGAGDVVSAQSVVEMLDRFYVTCIRTPRRYKKLWKEATKYVPIPDAERHIQYQLVPVARMRFYDGFHVEMELDTTEGRVDILVQAAPGGRSSGSCVLELKVLRSKYPSAKGPAHNCPAKDNDEAVVKGIGQAEAYRDTRDAELAFLVCYDFREDGEASYLDRFRPVADPKNVEMLWYPVYPDAETARRKRPGSAHEEAIEQGLIDE